VVSLRFRDFGGQGRAIVFLHGLFGSSQNWSAVGQRLSTLGHACALDLRNHGDSPHTRSHTLAENVEDVLGWVRSHAAGPLALVGHSMGGIVAMGFAMEHPDMVERLVVVDMAPRVYPLNHEPEFTALGTDIAACRSRGEIDSLLQGLVPDTRVRSFLLTNAVRVDGGFRWRLNVEALRTSTLLGDFARVSGSCGRPSLFLLGGGSRSVREADRERIRAFFPRAEVQVVPGADHWVHASAPEAFLSAVENFLSDHAGQV
jgi:pimeloyl-ACP methyl ester carboxylesterase